MGSEHYCLRWNNHQSNLLGVFSQLLRDESLVDVTLACSEGHSIRAHKVVLSACSSYFQTLFIDHPSRHPIVILKDVRFTELRTLIEFMYKGEVNIEYCQLSALLKTAESLKVKGLAEMTRDYKQEPEQTEPTELTKRQLSRPQSPIRQPQDLPNSPNVEDEESQQTTSQSPPAHNLRVCRSPSMLEDNVDQQPLPPLQPPPPPPPKRSPSLDTNNDSSRHLNSPPATSDCGPSDMTIHSNSNNIPTASCSGIASVPTICSTRLSSPLNTEPLPGPSNLPPVQQVPLSLKKEVDWSANLDEKNTGESSVDFSRHSHDVNSELDRHMDSPLERPSSTQSSRSSTPFALPFPSLPTSLLEVGLIHPSLLGEEIFRCPSCMAAFPSIWLLEQHTALQHIGTLNTIEKPFICDQCGQSYRYRSAYVKHREQNHRARLPADKLFSCDVCGMQFRYLKSFKKHRLNHALEKLHGKSGETVKNNENEDGMVGGNSGGSGGNSDGKINENSSDQVSSSNETIVVEEGREENAVVIKKERLNDDFNGESAVSDVDKVESEQDDTIDSMALTFPTSGSNFDLLRNTHDTSSIISFLRSDTIDKQRDRRFACPFCGKCVRSKENLKLHVRKHTGERPFVCLFCGRAFGGKSDLTRHLRIHTGERPYHCDMCGKCFARADYLSKHLTTHINTTR